MSVVAATSALLWGISSAAIAIDGDAAATSQPAIHVAHKGLAKQAWQLAVPTGTFTDRSVFETIELLHKLDIHHLELTPGQALAADMPGVEVAHTMPADAVTALLAKLKTVHMDVVSFGPIDLGPDDTSARAVFAFAKRIKAKDIVAAPRADALGRLDKLATEDGINVALRSGTGSPAYQMPDTLLKAIAALSPHIGTDDDLLEWQHTGADPLAATRSLRGHIVQIRVADSNAGDVQPVLAELKTQGFKGVITIACTPGSGSDEITRFVTAVNALSDAVTKVVAEK